jgi:hypothetical protein
MKNIKITVRHGENFTAASLMKRYADQTRAEFRRSLFGAAELIIDGEKYQYDHWSVTSENGADVVTLYLINIK